MTIQRNTPVRVLAVVLSVSVLTVIYVFQRFNFLAFFMAFIHANGDAGPNVVFIVNKSIRLVLNDLACLVLIKAIFVEGKYVKLAGLIFSIEVFILLPLYLYLKLTLEGDSEISSPLLSQIHRLIVNPMLMILLIVSFIYQRFKSQPGS